MLELLAAMQLLEGSGEGRQVTTVADIAVYAGINHETGTVRVLVAHPLKKGGFAAVECSHEAYKAAVELCVFGDEGREHLYALAEQAQPPEAKHDLGFRWIP